MHSAWIFYTLNGAMVGTPFKSVSQPHLLVPAVGLHSAREAVSFWFGVRGEEGGAPAGAAPAEHAAHPAPAAVPASGLAAGATMAADRAAARAARQLHPQRIGAEPPPFAFALEPYIAALHVEQLRLQTEEEGRRLRLQASLLQPSENPRGFGAARTRQGGVTLDEEEGSAEGEEVPIEEDEGYSALFRRMADVSDESEETRSEMVHFLRANVHMTQEELEGLSVQALRQISHLVLAELMGEDQGDEGDGEEGDGSEEGGESDEQSAHDESGSSSGSGSGED